jgi:hypothetical protein
VGSYTDHGISNEDGNSEQQYGRPLSKVHFYSMWNTRMPYVKVELCTKHIQQSNCCMEGVFHHGLFVQVRAFHRFAVCSECVMYNNEIARAIGPANLKLWKAAKELHINDVRHILFHNTCFVLFRLKVFLCGMWLQVIVERSAYHYRIQKSIHFKDTLSIVIDGSEMSRYGLPYFCQADKLTTER